MILVNDEKGRSTRVFVLGVLAQGSHVAAELPVPDRVRLWDYQLPGDLWRGFSDCLGIAENAHRLAAVDGRALYFRLALILRQLRLVRRIDRVATHGV